MDPAFAKQELNHDKTLLLTLIRNRPADVSKGQKALLEFAKTIKIKAGECADLNFSSLELAIDLHTGLFQFNTVLDKDFYEACAVVRCFKAKNAEVFTDDEGIATKIWNYLAIIERILIERCAEYWNAVVKVNDDEILIRKTVEIEQQKLSLVEIRELCMEFCDFEKSLKWIRGKVMAMIEKSKGKQLVLEEKDSLHVLKLVERPFDLENFEKVQEVLQDLCGNSKIIEKILRELVPPKPLVSPHSESTEKNAILEQVKLLVLSNDQKVTEVHEDTEVHSLKSLTFPFEPCNYSLPMLKIPESATSLINLIYNMREPPSSHLIKTIITRFVHSKKQRILSNSSSTSSICLFYNTCKYISYHLLVLTTQIKSLHSYLPITWSLNWLIYTINKNSSQVFAKSLQKIKFDIASLLELQEFSSPKLEETINQSLLHLETFLPLFHDLFPSPDSYKAIGHLIDYTLILILHLLKASKSDSFLSKSIICRIHLLNWYFDGKNPLDFCPSWSKMQTFLLV